MSPQYISNGFHLPYNPNLIEKARILPKNMTVPERKLLNEFLRNLEIPVLRQRPILDFIVDFYCASSKLIIEVDGDSHFTDDAKEYDLVRSEKFKSLGLTVIRFTNHEVMENFEGVCTIILEKIKMQIPL